MAHTESQEEIEKEALEIAGVSRRDFILSFLRSLAQAEHELMVQYLYAAYSVGGEEPSCDPTFLRECRDTLLAVAREEMGHLLTVQNMLLFIGGDVSLERWRASDDESLLKFRLEPFERSSLLRYLEAESPSMTVWEEEGLPKLDDPDLGPGLWLGGLDMFLQSPETIPTSMFNPATYPYQATWDEFARGYGPHNAKPYALDSDEPQEKRGHLLVATMTTRGQFRDALQDILAQGEGKIDWPLSHFRRFAGLFHRLESIRNTKGYKTWSPSRPVAVNPRANEAANETTQRWSNLFNLRYRILLSLLTYLFRVPRDRSASGGANRGQILGPLFGEMYNMKTIAGILVQLPYSADGKTMAGPPFEMPRALAQPISKATFWTMHSELLKEAEMRTEMLRESGESSPPEGKRYLQLMQEADQQAYRWVEKILAGEVSLP
jgi:hypothetical protein